MKENQDVYMVHITPGPQWHKNTTYKKQKNINQHVTFMKDLFRDHKISHATASLDNKNNFYVIKDFDSEIELKKKLNKNPLIKDKILTAKIIKSKLHMKEHKHN